MVGEFDVEVGTVAKVVTLLLGVLLGVVLGDGMRTIIQLA